MNIKKVFICIVMLFVLFNGVAFATESNLTAKEFVEQELVPFLEANDREAILFAAELNISNGTPYARLYGERYMFGYLVAAESYEYKETNGKLDIDKYLPDVNMIRAEVIRLLLNPSYTPSGELEGKYHYGNTEFEYDNYRDVMYLDYETGTWKRWTGDILGISIKHTTEFEGHTRYRVIGVEEPLKFCILWIEWR